MKLLRIPDRDLAAAESTLFDASAELLAGLEHVGSERQTDARRDVLVLRAARLISEADRDPGAAPVYLRQAGVLLSDAIQVDRIVDEHREANARRERRGLAAVRAPIAIFELHLAAGSKRVAGPDGPEGDAA